MWGQVLSQVLTPAVGIAAGPIPMIAIVLMLLSARSARTVPAFTGGWLAGLVLVSLLVMTLVPRAAAAGDGPAGTVVGIALLLLGVVLAFLAFGQWRSRPRPGEKPRLPKWMSDVDRMSAVQAVGIGAASVALNPKNLSLALAAGLVLARTTTTGQAVTGEVVFVLVAGAGVLVPIVVSTLLGKGRTAALESWKDWLTRNNAAVSLTVLAVMSVALVGQGLFVLG